MFVQFIHPGNEHTTVGGTIGWSYEEKHKRKFVKAQGEYLNSPTINQLTSVGDVTLWCEWEPQSNVVCRMNPAIPTYPKTLFEPYLDLTAPYSRIIKGKSTGRQNTDPCIFGDEFKYFLCRQRTTKGTFKSITRLTPGSVILFGSENRFLGQFVVDTVFVISDRPPITFTESSFVHMVSPHVSLDYMEVSMKSAFHRFLHVQRLTIPTVGYKLFFGATYNNPVNGMFSFSPVKPYDKKDIGFSRPSIVLPPVIVPTLNQGYKLTTGTNDYLLWSNVVNQVLAAGLQLGVKFQDPPNLTPS